MPMVRWDCDENDAMKIRMTIFWLVNERVARLNAGHAMVDWDAPDGLVDQLIAYLKERLEEVDGNGNTQEGWIGALQTVQVSDTKDNEGEH